mmetsp:Transcript_37117/g.78342  ORF Transcript_37117/g.78342 Transcript_37117/m.78342 type:complete len:140 (+) Transcript_37117:212-631(+)
MNPWIYFDVEFDVQNESKRVKVVGLVYSVYIRLQACEGRTMMVVAIVIIWKNKSQRIKEMQEIQEMMSSRDSNSAPQSPNRILSGNSIGREGLLFRGGGNTAIALHNGKDPNPSDGKEELSGYHKIQTRANRLLANDLD